MDGLRGPGSQRSGSNFVRVFYARRVRFNTFLVILRRFAERAKHQTSRDRPATNEVHAHATNNAFTSVYLHLNIFCMCPAVAVTRVVFALK